MVLARPDERETCPYHLRTRLQGESQVTYKTTSTSLAHSAGRQSANSKHMHVKGVNNKHHHHHHHHHPSRLLVYRAATKLLHPGLSLASLWMVPQLWFMLFISASTVLRQVVFSRPCFCFPSGVQWIATLVMELSSLCSLCPLQRHRLLVMVVSISSCWHRAKR